MLVSVSGCPVAFPKFHEASQVGTGSCTQVDIISCNLHIHIGIHLHEQTSWEGCILCLPGLDWRGSGWLQSW